MRRSRPRSAAFGITWGGPAFLGFGVLRSLLAALSYTRAVMAVLVICLAGNAGLNWVVINGHSGHRLSALRTQDIQRDQSDGYLGGTGAVHPRHAWSRAAAPVPSYQAAARWKRIAPRKSLAFKPWGVLGISGASPQAIKSWREDRPGDAAADDIPGAQCGGENCGFHGMQTNRRRRAAAARPR